MALPFTRRPTCVYTVHGNIRENFGSREGVGRRYYLLLCLPRTRQRTSSAEKGTGRRVVHAMTMRSQGGAGTRSLPLPRVPPYQILSRLPTTDTVLEYDAPLLAAGLWQSRDCLLTLLNKNRPCFLLLAQLEKQVH